MKDSASRPISHYLAIFGGLILLTYVGCVFMTGNITIYLSSYLQHHGYSITTQDLSAVLSLQVLGCTIGFSISPLLIFKLSPFITIILGTLLNLSSFFIVPYLFNYYLILLFYGLFYGLGCGIIYLVPLIVVWNLFPKQKAQVAGIIMAGFGLGPGIFNIITTLLINPYNLEANLNINNDLYFSSEVSDNFTSTLNWIIFIHLCMSITGLILLFIPGQFGIKVEQKCEKIGTLTLMQAIKTKSFFIVSILPIFSLCSGYFIVINFKTFGKIFINDDKYLALVGSVGGLFDGSFRFFWGFIMDYTSFKVAFKINLALQCFTLGITYFVAGNKVLYLICIAILLSCKGGNYVLTITLCEKVFGKVIGPKVIGIISYCFFISSFLSVLLDKLLRVYIGYLGLFIVLMGFTIVAFVSLEFFEEKCIANDGELEKPLV